jgi:Bacterial protein of unknown function (Gcw_chp)
MEVMKKIACVAALVLACVPVSGLTEESKPDIKAPEEKKPQTTKPEDNKAKSDEKKEKRPETKQLGPKSPWDIWFGAAIMSDYNFRGITQSNHRPSAASYFEPRYNFNNSLQAYLGLSGETISYPNRAPSEIDFYSGVRQTFANLALDFGAWYYWYTDGECLHDFVPDCRPNMPNGNVVKADLNFWEIYGKAIYTASDRLSFGGSAYWSRSVFNSGAEGTFLAGTARYILPTVLPNDIGWFASADVGHWFLGTSDSFYAVPGFPGGIPYKSYTTWDAGLAFTWKQFTLDLRYYDTDLNKGDCNAFTGDFTAGGVFSTAINPRRPGSNWCGATFLAKLSVDLDKDNLKKSEDNKSETKSEEEERPEGTKPQGKKPKEERPEGKMSSEDKRSEEKRAGEKYSSQSKGSEEKRLEEKKSADEEPADKEPEKKQKPNEKTPWDIALGGALWSEFNIRGISASNHRPSPVPYFEPRYDFSDSLQAYVRLWGNAFASPNRGAVAINLFAGIRPTFGRLALDFGLWQRWFPAGQCVPAPANPGICLIKADLSYWEIYAKATYDVDKRLSVGGGAYWSPSVLNSDDPATYVVATAKYVLPTMRPWDVGWFISGEVGHWYREQTPYPSYTNWNLGLAFTWKQFTLDIRYSDTNVVNCDIARIPNVTVNPGLATDHCRSTFLGKLSVDLTKDNLR